MKVELLPDEKKEAKQEKAKIKQKQAKEAGSMGDLEKMILAKRGNAFGGFMNYMEDKYGKDDDKAKGKKKRKLSKFDKGDKDDEWETMKSPTKKRKLN